jgi:hypothetical protein
VPAGLRYQERDIAKFQGENIPSKTFKYLQYITQEELALEEQEKKNRAMMPKQQPVEVQAQPMRPAQPPAGSVSSLAFNLQDFQTQPLPKPSMNGPVSFSNSALNKDRGSRSANSTSITLNNVAPNSCSIFDIKPNQEDAGSYPFAQTLNYESPKNLPTYSNVAHQQQQPEPKKTSTFSINAEQVAACKEQESFEPASECSFLTSSCNETTFKFNNISDNSSQSQAPVVEVTAPGKLPLCDVFRMLQLVMGNMYIWPGIENSYLIVLLQLGTDG